MPDTTTTLQNRSGFLPYCIQNRFLILFCSLLFMMVASPIADAVDRKFASLLISVLFTLLLVAAVFATSRSRRFLIGSLVLGIPTFLLLYINTVVHSRHLVAMEHFFSILFVGFESFAIFRLLFRWRQVTRETIFAALCVYLLMGVLFALVYSFLVMINLASFNCSFELPVDEDVIRFGTETTHYTLYFSFVTMTTLGFGDITPASNLARMIVSVQAIIGQLYLAVLVARLVGMHGMKNEEKELEARS